MDYYISSDIHLFHKNILKFYPKSRPFSSLDEMHERFIENWNNTITEDDVTYLLGDISFGKPDETVDILNKLNGKIRLVIGNHDSDRLLNCPNFCSRFEWIKMYNEERLFGKDVIMFHFPILHWNRKYHQSIHLHGHTHSTNPFPLTTLSYDVGIDASSNFTPNHLSTLLTYIQTNVLSNK